MPDFQLDKFGPFAILQLAAAVMVLGGLALAIYRGSRDRNATGSPQIPQEQRWFFDGPLSVAINLLRDNRNHLGRIVDILDSVPEEQRKQTELLREIKSEIDNLPSVRSRR